MLVTAIKEELNINSYIKDGFEKVCDVAMSHGKRFIYKSINNELMYASHRSWVYMIVSGETIVKIGETGNPLGIEKSYSDQPITGTKSRLGRLASHGSSGDQDTDLRIRTELYEDCIEGKVSIWARRCNTIRIKHIICGLEFGISSTIHKDLELLYLDYIERATGSYPRLNAGRK